MDVQRRPATALVGLLDDEQIPFDVARAHFVGSRADPDLVLMTLPVVTRAYDRNRQRRSGRKIWLEKVKAKRKG